MFIHNYRPHHKAELSRKSICVPEAVKPIFIDRRINCVNIEDFREVLRKIEESFRLECVCMGGGVLEKKIKIL